MVTIAGHLLLTCSKKASVPEVAEVSSVLIASMPFSYGLEKLEPAFEDRAIPYIAYGAPFDFLAAQHIKDTLNASRVYIVCSTSLAKNTNALSRLQHSLQHAGIEVVGTRTGFSPHTRWNQVVDCANDARPKNPEVIITLGAGSLTDAVKVICWMLANDIDTGEKLNEMLDKSKADQWKQPIVRQVAIPTSLSGGEYQALAGITRDDGSDEKCGFLPPAKNPSLVILDPELTTTTPERIWLSTGVRAIDHCVETLCSLQSNEKGDAAAEKGLKRLVPGLIRTKHDMKDADARFETMMGVIEAMDAVGSGVPLGASHAIGHQLGPLGVGHGETSCVNLPAVCKWNAAQNANNDRQSNCLKILLEDPVTRKLIEDKLGHESAEKADLGDVLDIIIRELGMPRTLKEVNVSRDKFDILAKNSLGDIWIQTNAKPITEKEQVLEILEMVAE